MQITDILAIALAVPAPNAASVDQAQEAVILRVETDEGLTGIAEVNHTPTAVCAFVDAPATSSQTRGLRDILLGRDPCDIQTLRRDLLAGNQSSSRRGCGLAVLNAVDVALWDIAAQAAGVPLWRLLWGEDATAPRAYLTLYTGPSPFDETVRALEELIDRAHELDCSSYKLEPLDDCVPEERIAEFVAHACALLGEEAEILIDTYQRFPDAETAADFIRSLEHVRPVLMETPLPIDDVRAYARLVELVDVPIAGAELFESHWEFEALLHYGGIEVAQPWPNRMGVSGTLAVIERARALGRQVTLGGWNATPIGNLLGIHLAAGLGSGLVLEHAPSALYEDSFVLRDIGGPEPRLVEGRFPLPSTPGLGVELDNERVDYYAGLAERVG